MQKGSYVTLCICRITLAWVSSENSTTLLECRFILTRLPSLLWTSSHPTGLSALVSIGHSRHPSPTASSSSFIQLFSLIPLPTAGLAEILSPKPFVWFRAQTEKGIVCLADHLHSVTYIYIYIYMYRLELPKLCYHPGWRLMRLGITRAFTCCMMKKKIYIYI